MNRKKKWNLTKYFHFIKCKYSGGHWQWLGLDVLKSYLSYVICVNAERKIHNFFIVCMEKLGFSNQSRNHHKNILKRMTFLLPNKIRNKIKYFTQKQNPKFYLFSLSDKNVSTKLWVWQNVKCRSIWPSGGQVDNLLQCIGCVQLLVKLSLAKKKEFHISSWKKLCRN